MLFSPDRGGTASRDAARRMDELGNAGTPFLFVIDYEGREPLVIPWSELPETGIRIRFSGMNPALATGIPENTAAATGTRFLPSLVPFALYRGRFELIQRHLRRGDSYLVNLTFPTVVQTTLTLEGLWSGMLAPYCLCWPGRFACFSPERFVRFEGESVFTCPMKGTADAGKHGAKRKLMQSIKEQAEHVTVVDLLRNDLSAIASDVRVTRYRYPEKVTAGNRQLWQTSSEITGILPADWRERIGSLLFALLPAGSITGAPKKRTMEIIDRAETDRRGWYTGVFGYFDGRILDSAVIIRYAEIPRDGSAGLICRSGGGITLDSDPEREYREMGEKVYVPVS